MHRTFQMGFRTTLVLLSIFAVVPLAVGGSNPSVVSDQQITDASNVVHPSLQDMINQAEPGATIQLPSGICTEVLTIDKPLHIRGEGTIRTVLSPTSPTNGYAIQITAEGVTLSNLEIMNQAAGLYTTSVKISASNTTIENCSFHDTPIGLAVWSAQNTISHCVFQGCDDEGIVLLGTSNLACADNTITSCLFSENCDGIELQYATHNQINSCSFIRNTHAGIDGIESNNNNNIISECTFTDNNAFGLYLSKSSDNLIAQCTFSDDTLTLVHATQNTLYKSQIENIHLLDDSCLLINQCIGTTTENIISEQSTFEIRTNRTGQSPLEEKIQTARYYPILNYILSYLKTQQKFYEQRSQTQM